MPEKSFENIPIITYVWVFAFAIFGGCVSYLRRLRHGKQWKTIEFLIEITSAAFVGLVTYLLATGSGIDSAYAAALTGISGHFSNQAIKQFGKILNRVLGGIGETK